MQAHYAQQRRALAVADGWLGDAPVLRELSQGQSQGTGETATEPGDGEMEVDFF